MSRHLSRMQALALGLIVLAGLGLGLFGLFAVGNRNGLDGSAFPVRVGFSDVAGVEVGTRVRIQGIDAPATIATRSAVIFIVSPHPIRTAVALVTPLRHEIEVLVVDIHHVDAARVR